MNLRPHVLDIIAKIYIIGRKNYNGKIYDNVINIFDELSLDDQKELIRGVLGLYSVTTNTLIHEKEVVDAGDIDALLVYLRKIREDLKKNSHAPVSDVESVIYPTTDPPSSPAPPAPAPSPKADKPPTASVEEIATQSAKKTIRNVILGALFLGCSHILFLSYAPMERSAEAAKFYRNLLSIVIGGK